MAYNKNNLATGATITKSALDNMENGIAAAAEASSLSTVATTGSYNDLLNKPSSSGSTALPYVYLSTPSGTDDTAAIQAALDSFDNTPMPGVKLQSSSGAFQSGNQANGGGTVVLGPGVWIASTIVLGHRQRLFGAGWTTVLRQKASTTGNLISNQRDNSVHAQYCEVAHIQLDGNKTNQTAANHGIYFLGDKSNNYQSPLDEDYDVNNYIHHVYVRGFKGWGIYLDGSGENIVTDFKILRCDAGGMRIYQDNYITTGTIGWSGGHGLWMEGDDSRVNAVKTWYSTLAGFYITADSGVLSGCSAQDNIQQGLLLKDAYGIAVSGFMADSNSRGSTGSYYQVEFDNSAYCTFNGLARNRYNVNGPGTKGLKHFNSSTYNDITFVGALSPWGVSTAYSTTDSTKANSKIVVNGVTQ